MGTVVNTAVVDHQVNSGSISGSYSLQNPSGNERLLVAIFTTGDSQGSTEYHAFPTSVTFNSTAMTEATKAEDTASTNTGSVFIYYIKEADLPASAGSYTLSATWSGSWIDAASVSVVELSGIDQTTPIASVDTDTGFGTSTTLTPASAGDLLISGVHANNEGGTAPTVSAGGTATTIYTITEGGSGEDWFDKEQAGGASYEVGASSMSWTASLDATHEAAACVAINYSVASSTSDITTGTMYGPEVGANQVANSSAVTVLVWHSATISGAPDETLTNQSITSGVLTATVQVAPASSVSYLLKWTESTEDRFMVVEGATTA